MSVKNLKAGDKVRCITYEGVGITVGSTYTLTHDTIAGIVRFTDDAGDQRSRPHERYEAVVEPKVTERFDKPYLLEYLSADTRKGLREAARAIRGGFIWEGTAEGHDYWSAVHARLEQLSRGELKLPKVDPKSYETEVPEGYETVAYALARTAPERLDDGVKIGAEVARRYSGPRVWVQASEGETKACAKVQQVRAYPRDWLLKVLPHALKNA